MAENEDFERYRWEDFEVGYTFTDASGKPISVESIIFSFTYSDASGNKMVVSYDGKNRINNVVRDGELIVIFNRETFYSGRLQLTRKFYAENADFKNRIQVYGDSYPTNIVIKK